MNNTVVRTLSGICFLVIVISSLLVSKFLFAALMLFLTATMLYEFYRMTMGEKFRGLQLAAIILSCIAFGLVFFSALFPVLSPAVPATLLFVPGLMSASLFIKDKADFKQVAFLFTGILYIALPLILSRYVVLDGEGNFSGRLMLAFLIVIWASDVGAYCVGMLLGKYTGKLAPAISPNKSWAGYWGGLLFAVLAGAILVWTGFLQFPMVHVLVMALLMHVAGVFGDLFESQWKRVCGVKDSGSIMPGHGGMLDRFDSALFAIPMGIIYLTITGLF